MSENTILKKISERNYDDAVAFHGHSCGGLALGYVAALYAKELLNLDYSEDEEVVVITETDSCTVDAIQTILGTTAGKGNLFVNNWGKTAFSFYNRKNGKSVRLIMKPDFFKPSPEMDALRAKVFSGTATEEETARYHELSDQRVNNILATHGSEVYEVKEPQQSVPEKAKIFDNIICPICNESVGVARCIEKDGQKICQFCAQKK
ncbi:FmdE family protein [Methanimicrococcus sp. OttesenSCG-928-J09]|nr:FmdE family protein [Methanimicrococcus sp. OttesenSCG-928-J09]